MMSEDELAKEYPDLYNKWYKYGYEAGKRISRKGFIKEKSKEITDLEERYNAADVNALVGLVRQWKANHADLKQQFKEYKAKHSYKKRKKHGSYQQKRSKAYRTGFCIYCGQDADTMDHMTPKSRGGSNKPENMIPACVGCNMEKGNMTYKEYMAWKRYHKPN